MEITGDDIIYTYLIAITMGLIIGLVWNFIKMAFFK
jgi:hypothetical protein